MIQSSVYALCVMNGMSDTSPIRFYLDTNAFIEMFERKTNHSDLLWQIYLDSHPKRIVVSSELTLAEILVKPLQDMRVSGDVRRVNDYCSNIADKGSFQRIIPIGRSVLEEAAKIRAYNKKIKLPDAIHIATATLNKINYFVSNDRDLADAVKAASPAIKLGRFVRFDELSSALTEMHMS
jgi:predicted nucleic acid-binding protein